MRKTKAFTLIELLIVVVIIGILATLVILALGSMRNKAKNVALKDSIKKVQDAFELGAAQNPNNYDTACKQLSASATCTAALAFRAMTTTDISRVTDEGGRAIITSLPNDTVPNPLQIRYTDTTTPGRYQVMGVATDTQCYWVSEKASGLSATVLCSAIPAL